MAQVLIRNLDEQVVDALRARAEMHGRSLEQELRNVLTSAARPTREERLRMADDVRSLTANTPQSDSTALIREDRDRR